MSAPNLFFPTQPGLLRNAPGYDEKFFSQNIENSICYFYSILPVSKSILSIPILPDGCMDIVFIENSKGMNAYVIGTGTHISGFDILEGHTILGIRFQPGGFQEFFQMNAKEVRNTQVELGLVCKGIDLLCEQLSCEPDIYNRINVCMEFLLNRKRERVESMGLVLYCVNEIYKSKGIITVKELAEKSFYSERYIEKSFNSEIGLSPKAFSDICRIQMAVNYVKNNPDENMLQVACEYGYVDHTHMNRHLKKYLNTSAKKLQQDSFFMPRDEKINVKYIL